jgi:hypothetical protein
LSDQGQVVGRRLGVLPVLPASVVVEPDGTVLPLPAQVFDSPAQVRAAIDGAVAKAAG